MQIIFNGTIELMEKHKKMEFRHKRKARSKRKIQPTENWIKIAIRLNRIISKIDKILVGL